jgi:gas vesicle protein
MAEKREFVLGMLIGSAVGAAVALLYAPQGGQETREIIRTRSGEARDKVTEAAGNLRSTVAHKTEDVRSAATGAVDKGKHLYETKKAQVVAAVDAGKQAYQQKKSELEAEVKEDLDSGLGGGERTNGASA